MMKNSLFLASFVGLAAANIAQLEKSFQALLEAKSTADPRLRALPAISVQNLDNYGCWCYLTEETHGNGKGPHGVNEVDSACKVLHDGYTCIMEDAIAENTVCNPWEAVYNSSIGIAGEKLVQECEKLNSNPCSQRTCIVEGHFVLELFTQYLNFGQIDQSKQHAAGFNPDEECLIRHGLTYGIESEKTCCGSYPTRFPFKTMDGERACCGERTYNTNLLTCCDDNTAKLSC